MIDTTQLLDAGKRYIAAEQAFEQAKKDLDKACSEYGRYAHETSLPIFIWDHGRLYQLHHERAATPKFREIAPSLVAVAPTAG